MADKIKYPVTQGIRFLRAAKVGYTEHATIKTLIMEDENKSPLMVLIHGDLEVSTKELARIIGVKTIKPCAPATANKLSGYQVGGTSPLNDYR